MWREPAGNAGKCGPHRGTSLRALAVWLGTGDEVDTAKNRDTVANLHSCFFGMVVGALAPATERRIRSQLFALF